MKQKNTLKSLRISGTDGILLGTGKSPIICSDGKDARKKGWKVKEPMPFLFEDQRGEIVAAPVELFYNDMIDES